MADSPEEPQAGEAGDAGGPVKTFLEHLEDLRWMLIKSAAALFIALLACLYAVPVIVWVLKRPLAHAAIMHKPDEHRAVLRLGTNTLATLDLTTNRIGNLNLGTNWFSIIQLVPVQSGSNMVLAVRVEPDPSATDRADAGTGLVYLDPSGPFFSSVQLAFYGGLLLALPFIFYFIAQFVLPALRIRERKYILRACLVGVGLFFAGVALCYFFVLPRALKFAEWWAMWMGVTVPEWRAETYFSFVCKFMMGMGLGFELPVVLLALVKIGLLDYEKLSMMRRYMIVINLVLGALLTTPEVFTQVVMAVVLQILFEVSVWIAWYWERQERRRSGG